ncbi:hypothetical protein VP01_869g4 [Puccinia sorghi]|uniref:Uncharacterized protein n=1 Tax=Puccinia sorghi TaxID=27349 RepID=A0A0L6U8P7_9BASI|nr:hypothetical protein VP01_869g4 [Puccinia sorghi]
MLKLDDEAEAAAEILWPILFSNYSHNPEQRILILGGSKYLIPIKNPTTDSATLISGNLPQTSKQKYKQKSLQAVGKNNNLMSNWLHVMFKVNNVDNRLLTGGCTKLRRLEIIPHLNKKKRCKKDTKLDSAMDLDELQEFNNLKYENGISGIKKPVISASLTAAASSNHRLHSGTETHFISSIYREKCLRAQENYVLTFNELQPRPRNPKQNTPLNDTGLYNEI